MSYILYAALALSGLAVAPVPALIVFAILAGLRLLLASRQQTSRSR